MTNSNSEARVLSIFTVLYSLAMLFQLGMDINFITGNLTLACSKVTEFTGMAPRPLYILLMVLVFLGIFLKNNFRWLWLLTAAVYFVLFREFVLCQTTDHHGLPASNHILPFWVFVTLGFAPLMNERRSLFLLRFLLLFSYFAGGIAKIRTGTDWMNGYTLQKLFLMRHIFLDLPVAMALVSDLFWAKFLSWFVVLTELSIPVVLLNKKIEYFYGFCFFIFQIICWYVLELQFMRYYGWLYLIYVAILLNAAIQYLQVRRARRIS